MVSLHPWSRDRTLLRKMTYNGIGLFPAKRRLTLAANLERMVLRLLRRSCDTLIVVLIRRFPVHFQIQYLVVATRRNSIGA